jgi:hypothetical protein
MGLRYLVRHPVSDNVTSEEIARLSALDVLRNVMRQCYVVGDYAGRGSQRRN